jgi:iron(III) transport system permease protein
MYLLVAAIAFVVLYPVGSVILRSITVDGAAGQSALGLDAWPAALAQPGLLTSIWNTLKVVALTQAIAFPAAIMIAWLLARTDIPASGWLEFGFWILYFLPALGTITGWLLLFDPSYGLVNQMLVKSGLFSTAPFDLYSFGGIVFIHLTTYSIAVKVMLLTPAFRSFDGTLDEASQICGASGKRTLMKVFLPVLGPPIVVAFLMSLIRSLESFEIELVLGLPANFAVYSTKMYQVLRGSPPDYAGASVLATMMLVLMMPLLFLQRWLSLRRNVSTLTGQFRPTVRSLGRWRWPAFWLLLALVSCMSLLPLALQVVGSAMTLFGFFDLAEVWTLAHWQEAFSDAIFAHTLWNTLVLGIGTAALAVAVYSVVAYFTVRTQYRGRAVLDILTWLPLTVPGIILGFGLLAMALQVPLFRPLYGTIGALIFACWLTSMTLGTQVMKSNLLLVGKDVEEAGRVVGGTWPKTFVRVMVPLMLPAMVVVAVMVFSQTIRQVSTIILLSTGATSTLSILQLEFLSTGRLGPAAVVGTIIVLTSLIAAIIVRLVAGRFGVLAR